MRTSKYVCALVERYPKYAELNVACPQTRAPPEHGAESDLGLAETHITAEQPVHGNLSPDHVILDLRQAAELQTRRGTQGTRAPTYHVKRRRSR